MKNSLSRFGIVVGAPIAAFFLASSVAPQIKTDSPQACPSVVDNFSFSRPHSGAFILPENEQENTFTLLSMNIQNMSIKNGSYPKNRMDCLGKLAAHFDLVALQENFERDIPQPEKMARTPETSAPFYMHNGSGLTLYSKGVFSNTVFKPYTVCNGYISADNDCLARKGAEISTAHINGLTIPVITTHLDAGRDAADQKTRIAQLQEMETLIPQTGLVLVAGDFNMLWGQGDIELNDFLFRNNLSLYLRSDAEKGLDLVAGRGLKPLNIQTIPKFNLSDHDGLAVKFRLKN